MKRDYKFTQECIGKRYRFKRNYSHYEIGHQIYFVAFWDRKLLFRYLDGTLPIHLFMTKEDAIKYLTDGEKYCPLCGKKYEKKI